MVGDGRSYGVFRLSVLTCGTLTLLRDLMTPLLSVIGLGLPCSLRNRPHALQRFVPSSAFLHSGVVVVSQFIQAAAVPCAGVANIDQPAPA